MTKGRTSTPVLDRLASGFSVEKDGCWVWKSHSPANGYARFKLGGRMLMAHRVMWEQTVGPIPDGLQLDHLCRNRACVNPDHLEPVTPQENTLRGLTRAASNAAKTHCKRGHELTDDNLVPWASRRGWRICLVCHRAWDRERKRKRAA